ncbi:MAG TPA: hypothetical protein PKY77_17850 [Phycisphaerae bacterium]|nr:hypothetical protein [Phycisphaerae bacterium]HRY68832.1 hypothetical protein [Phycisphaerae bacterium]HSA27497.1 hypothetical protein [Phycisphaerae bacterium]
MRMDPTQMTSAAVATATPELRQRMLRQVADELVGATFFGPMLKMARENPFKGKIGHGGRGEDMFGAQLDMALAKRASISLKTDLSDAICKRYAKGINGDTAQR